MTRMASRSARTTWRAPMRRTPSCSAPSAARNGIRCPTMCARKPAFCGCARISSSSPICARRSAIRRWPMPRRLKRELVDGLDMMIVRELTGGVYFGEPKEIIDLGNGQKRAVDTQVIRDLRDRAHRPCRLRAGAQAPQQGDVLREAQCDEVGRAVARGRSSICTSANSLTSSWNISSPMPAACSSCAGRSSST